MNEQSQVKYRNDYLPPDYTISDVYLEFNLDANKTIVKATSQVSLLADQLVDFKLDGEQLTLISLCIDGVSYPHFTQTESALIIHNLLESPLPKQFTLEITNQIDPSSNTALEGLYQSGEALCTQCEAEGFRRITYYLDRPDVLAKFTTKIIADKKHYPYLLSNGNQIEKGDIGTNQHFVIWQDPFPKPSYLFALVAGDFDVLKDNFITKSNRNIELMIFVDKGNLDKAPYAMESLKASMKWDENRFDLEYDLDVYMIVAVDFFNMGAMENKGLNIFNSKFVLAKTDTATDVDYQNIEAVIGHEYFHNWTGNRITCRDWFQLSLKEGLTVFRDQEFSSDMGSRALKRIDDVRLLRTVQFAEDAGPMAHPIRPEKVLEMNNFYTVTVYEKGAEVIRMLHTLLGERHFQAGMKNYINQFDGSAATCDDFLSSMQLAADQALLGLDLTQFALWYSQSGTPEVNIKDHFDKSSGVYRITITQTLKPTADQSDKKPMMIPLGLDFYSQTGEKLQIKPKGHSKLAFNENTQILLLTKAEEIFEFESLSEKPVPSFLRNFTAPIKLQYDYLTPQLELLMQYAENSFIRWDAGQTLLSQVIDRTIHSLSDGQGWVLDESLIDIYRSILLDKSIDLGLTTELLTLPSVGEVVQWYQICDPILIDTALNLIKTTLGFALQDEFYTLYQTYQQSEYKIDAKSIAQRGFVNLALSYLAHSTRANTSNLTPNQLEIDETEDSSVQEFSLEFINNMVSTRFSAHNMTDKIAALNIAVLTDLPCKNSLLKQFETQYQGDSLAMDKWLSAQAQTPSSNAVTLVRELTRHPSFSMQNPNRVRALIGAFIMYNHKGFHAEDGSGYELLEEILMALNLSNPQVASRLIEPLIKFKQYDEVYSSKMKKTLERMSKIENLSRDLFEKITKALES
ncbi:aminopeptidase N [Thorsellia anophelis]|uniref:Aminopeptidase N n=1 Tax=Thorsellia anophelis DSM 18579 TaxID=1123402 RepID=A0A1I0EHP8_9GAMM|nr:aminopeptidase N [Thorsellia anophelis]SET44846.1 aminopeptidase N [Thorsellia anophelis DSM 18579]